MRRKPVIATNKSSIVRRSALVRPTRRAEDEARIDAAMQSAVDTSDIPEHRVGGNRVKRDAAGRLPKRRPSPLRDAILAELERRGMTRRELWEAAHAKIPRLRETEMYEFLRGQKEIGADQIDTMLMLMNLMVVPAA